MPKPSEQVAVWTVLSAGLVLRALTAFTLLPGGRVGDQDPQQRRPSARPERLRGQQRPLVDDMPGHDHLIGKVGTTFTVGPPKSWRAQSIVRLGCSGWLNGRERVAVSVPVPRATAGNRDLEQDFGKAMTKPRARAAVSVGPDAIESPGSVVGSLSTITSTTATTGMSTAGPTSRQSPQPEAPSSTSGRRLSVIDARAGKFPPGGSALSLFTPGEQRASPAAT